MADYAVISLSDLLVKWQIIHKRLTAAAQADFVTVLYNPKSKTRVHQLEDAVKIFLAHRSPGVPAAVATAVGSSDEKCIICTLGSLLEQEITMRSIVIIGAGRTLILNNKMVTQRGYEKKIND